MTGGNMLGNPDAEDNDDDDGEVRDPIHPHPASFCLTQPTPLLRTDHYF